ncbi:glycosyl hydrolase [Niabella yanshanensis]|uniref:Glycosyl hydrolase n=1 Tax=Niabella yanshanensis TaxID=577386 RepID=A0ABZ0W635_9BACT|nr:glycosyl hydrolase [Niabella yanshanensis]WQD38068.1 glycosyl hydrolase [Niabella yanshanensis]
MRPLLCSVAFVVMTASGIKAQLAWPVIRQQHKPWTRWWWEGSAVNEKGLTWNLDQYQKAGLGGVEITPIYGVYGEEQNFVNFLSPRWMQLFSHTLNESKRLGLGVDLANGTGWPFGGPWVKDADASKAIFHKVYTLEAGGRLAEPVTFEREGFVRTANGKKLAIKAVNHPITGNKNLQELALDQVQFPGTLPLVTLMAYNENSKPIDLTSKVSTEGVLQWTAPAGSGKWTLYALFEGLHGKMVERAAPGGEGYAIDHFSKTAAQNYFKRFDEAFKGYDISYLRSFFNDSYEVDDARGEANWTPEFFNEFYKRKGYDLRTQLPALFNKSNDLKSSGVIYDYRSVIDELLLEHFTKEWKKWGEGKGKMLRNQSHGSPANTLDLYSVVDIPETEGNDVLRFKFATSAANVTGKTLVSSESATWLNEHFLSSWGDVKKALDLFFLGGVNHIFYHGTAYSPQEAKWPGWLFYAAVHFQPESPQWKHFHALNQYVARVQSFLQSGRPDNDLLLYYPIADRYSQPGNTLLQHFDGMEKNFVDTDFEHVAREMIEKGYSFDFFSDRQLHQFEFQNKHIVAGGNQFKAILLPAIDKIPGSSMTTILNLVRSGATLLVHRHLPQNVPGFNKASERTAALHQLLATLNFDDNPQVQTARLGKGWVYRSDDLSKLTRFAKARQEKPLADSVYMLRRKNGQGHFYFINNRTGQTVNEWIKLADPAATAALFDPASGTKGIARIRQVADGGIEVWTQLEPHGSVIIETYQSEKTGSLFPYQEPAGNTAALNGKWKLEFLQGGPGLPTATTLGRLGSWTEVNDEAAKSFSGIARYTLQFNRPSGEAPRYLLNLGKVNETAEVILNGTTVATLIGPSFTVTIPATAFHSTNQLEIVVANLMANRIAYMDRNSMPWKIFYNTNMPARKAGNIKDGLFNAAHWKPFPSGLSGPVTLTPLK